MTKEELYDKMCTNVMYNQDMLDEFFESNVVIPKGTNRHPYADVLHEWVEGSKMQKRYMVKDSTIQNQVRTKWIDFSLSANDEYRIKPKEPVYEYMYYTSDGKTEWYTDDEYADMINSEPYECFKAIETKREKR